ncbi:FHA domain containing protein [Coccidioides posadasii C735 delta SOWgp]|uniref:FHA domain containing protein n=1 Tax=Coccidioides posadasii (strain C735) TaxID=222929 RepID=C5PCH0_COCP7|nr:FHA domain containing protein [Coccidioides posadasii C735 delta SOWgp]EER25647.1 FHA domain containing protein [Coccidioides posadasii C735 delta SOWgp]|eukprot:XP_003067792.1 FHA domain containing protein [Coccidioides posadasii C735 delta SOWgp]
MGSNQLTLTVHCLDGHNPISDRVVSLDSNTHRIVLGRSSKVQAKNLVPYANNLWFDNPVLSRNHAEFTIIARREEAYLIDTKSMHGTWVNDHKLSSGKRALLEDGDIITFGARVTRGTEAFEPLRVRLGLSWAKGDSDGAIAKKSVPRPTNTFVVPDDDYDPEDGKIDVERDLGCDPEPEHQIAPGPDAVSNVHSPPLSSKEEGDDDGDDEDEGNSPRTSPIDHSTEKCPKENRPSSDIYARSDASGLFVQENDIEVAIPVSKNNTGPAEDAPKDGYTVIAEGLLSDVLEDSSVESIYSEDEFGDEADELEVIDNPQIPDADDRVVTQNATVIARLGEAVLPSTPESMQRDESVVVVPNHAQPMPQSTEESEPLCASPSMSQLPQWPRAFPREPSHQESTTSYPSLKVPTKNDTRGRSEKQAFTDSSHTSLLRTVDSGLNGWASWPSASRPVDLPKPPYTEGPFAGSTPGEMPAETYAIRRELRPDYMDFWQGPYSSKAAPLLPEFEFDLGRPSALLDPPGAGYDNPPWGTSCECKEDANHFDTRNTAESSHSNTKAENILGQTARAATGKILKRKFEEADISIKQGTDSFSHGEALPYPQPRDTAPKKPEFDSPRNEAGSTEARKEQVDPGPVDTHQPSKRTKVDNERPARMKSIAGYAATAAVGVFVGGVGAIVALASLPPDFFS